MDMNKYLRLMFGAVTVSAATVSGFAVDLGELTVASNLNQPLKAYIELLDLNEAQLQNLEISIADKDEFVRADLNYAPILQNFNFSIVKQNNDGKRYILITSEQPVATQDLSFLIDLYWNDGELIKEYQLKFARNTVAAPKENAKPQAAALDPSITSYKTKQQDNLWSIAGQYSKQYNVDRRQMMLAIYKFNTKAFLQGNMNKLQQNVKLNIPGMNDVANITTQEASQAISQHYKAWKAAVPIAPVAASSPVIAAAPAAAPAPAKLLKIRVASSLKDKDLEKSSTEINKLLRAQDHDALVNSEKTVQESVDTELRAHEELQDQLAELSLQKNSLEKLVKLKENAVKKHQAALKEQQQVTHKYQRDDIIDLTAVKTQENKPTPSVAKPVMQSQDKPAAPTVTAKKNNQLYKIWDYVISSAAVAAIIYLLGYVVSRRRFNLNQQASQEPVAPTSPSIGGEEEIIKEVPIAEPATAEAVEAVEPIAESAPVKARISEDEINAQLELTRTYLEIKDPEAARETLQELLAHDEDGLSPQVLNEVKRLAQEIRAQEEAYQST